MNEVFKKFEKTKELLLKCNINKADHSTIASEFFYFYLVDSLCEFSPIKSPKNAKRKTKKATEIFKISKNIIKIEKQISLAGSRPKIRTLGNKIEKMRERRRSMITSSKLEEFRKSH